MLGLVIRPPTVSKFGAIAAGSRHLLVIHGQNHILVSRKGCTSHEQHSDSWFCIVQQSILKRIKMKLYLNILLLAALSALTGTTGAVSPRKQYVVSYPQETDQSVLEQAMEAIKKAVRL